MSSSSSSLEKEIDEYQDVSFGVMRVVKVVQPIVILQKSTIHLGSLVFLWRNSGNYNVGWLLDLGLALLDSHLALLKTRRGKKILLIVVPLK